MSTADFIRRTSGDLTYPYRIISLTVKIADNKKEKDFTGMHQDTIREAAFGRSHNAARQFIQG